MEVRVENTPSAGTNNDPVHCFVAIELSKSSWVVGFQTPLSKQTSRYQVKACDAEPLLQLIERVRTRVTREVGRPVEVTSCYEAGYDGFWLHRVLEAHGIHNHVLDPASLQVNRRARRPKTDRIDADRMVVRALISHLRGEPEACSVVRVPSPEQEDARRLHRERGRLIAIRVGHVNRMGLCATKVSTITSRYAAIGWSGSTNYVPAMDAHYRRGSRPRLCERLSAWRSCSR